VEEEAASHPFVPVLRWQTPVVGPFALNAMPCKSCSSENLRKFKGEFAIHFPGLKNIGTRPVWVFPELIVCFDCGIAEFAVPEAELRQLKGEPLTAG
jgi:hypothetical protein